MLNEKLLSAVCSLVYNAIGKNDMYLWDRHPFYFLSGLDQDLTIKECMMIIHSSQKIIEKYKDILNEKILGFTCKLVEHAIHEDKIYLYDTTPYYYLSGLDEDFSLDESIEIIINAREIMKDIELTD